MEPLHEPHDQCDGTPAIRRWASRPDKPFPLWCQTCARHICDCEDRTGHHCPDAWRYD